MNLLTLLKNTWSHTKIWQKILLLIVVVGAGWFIWKTFFAAKASKTPQYQTSTVERGTLINAIAVSGTAANQGSTVTTNASGTVTKVYVKNGDTVVAGKPLFALKFDDAGQQQYASAYASYLSAKNSLASAQAKINSLQAALFKANQTFINDKGSTSDPIVTDPNYIQEKATWLQSEADYKLQTSVIAQAQAQLNAATISYKQSGSTVLAPLSGVIEGFSMQPGSLIAQTTTTTTTTTNVSAQKVAVIRSAALPTVAVSLTEIDVPKVKPGDKVTVTLDALPDKTYTGTVTSIDTNGQVSSNVATYPTVVTLDTPSSDILPNMSAAVNIITLTKTDVLLVPNSAIQTQNGQTSVQIMVSGKPVSKTVTVGASSDTQTEIVSGINEGDTVVTGTVATTTAATTGSAASPFSAGLRLGGGAGGGGNFTRAAGR